MINISFEGSDENYPYPQEQQEERKIAEEYIGDLVEYFIEHEGVYKVYYDYPKEDINRYFISTNNNAEFMMLFSDYLRKRREDETSSQ